MQGSSELCVLKLNLKTAAKHVNESNVLHVITNHNAAVPPYFQIQNREKKHVWLPSCGFDNSNGYATGDYHKFVFLGMH